MSRELLVAGSIALDTLEGPSGIVDDEFGGSALYFALAASLIMPVRMLAPVGRESEATLREVIAGRPIDASLVEVVDAPTFRWRAQHHKGRNIDLGSRDSIYDVWEPAPPPDFTGWAFVGSVRPDHQAKLAAGLASAEMLAADAMLSYVRSRTPDARRVLGHASWYFCNQEEFAALGGSEPEAFRREWGLDGLVLKAGPGGVSAFTPAGSIHVPALVGRQVVDTTGAGDAIAAGMLARWLQSGADPARLEEALVWGVACASIVISDIGLRAIRAATPRDLEERVEEVKECQRRES